MNPIVQTISRLTNTITQHPAIPAALQKRALEQLARAAMSIQYTGGSSALEMVERYVEFIVSLPWEAQTNDTLDIQHARDILESRHYGLPKVKERVLEYLASVVLIKQKNPQAVLRAPSLFFVGLAGTGKTSFAAIIAEALGRSFARIPFGGLSNALDLRGQSKTSPYAQPGIILRTLAQCKSKNPVILLDEMDRVNPQDRAGIMGALLEILDPNQNNHFQDYFLDYPFDLSQVMFVGTSNNTKDISTAVLDRLEVIQMPSYTDTEKIMIGTRFVLPKLIAEAGLESNQLTIAEAVWPKLVRPLGFEPGIRSLERLLESIVRKLALQVVSGTVTQLTLTEDNMFEYVDMTLASG